MSSAVPDVIDLCLKLVPVPYLSLAFTVARTICNIVRDMQGNKAQFVVLAETAATLLVTLDKQYRGNKKLDGNTEQTLDEMLQCVLTTLSRSKRTNSEKGSLIQSKIMCKKKNRLDSSRSLLMGSRGRLSSMVTSNVSTPSHIVSRSVHCIPMVSITHRCWFRLVL